MPRLPPDMSTVKNARYLSEIYSRIVPLLQNNMVLLIAKVLNVRCSALNMFNRNRIFSNVNNEVVRFGIQ